jgi:hypothetical protein
MKAIGLDRRTKEPVGLHRIMTARDIMPGTGKETAAGLSMITTGIATETATSTTMTTAGTEIMTTVETTDSRRDGHSSRAVWP